MANPCESRHAEISNAAAVQRALNAFEEWCCLWKLKLNPTKCKSLTISRVRETEYHKRLRYRVTNQELERVSVFKYLGLYVDEKLNYTEHLEQVSSKLTALLNRLCFLKKTGVHLKPRAILSIYKTKGRSRIEYGALHFIHKDTDNHLQALQNRILRFATTAKRTTPTALLERLTDLEPVQQRIETLQCRHWLRTLYAPDGHPLHTAKTLHIKYNGAQFQGRFGDAKGRFGGLRLQRRKAVNSYYQTAPSQLAEGTYTRYASTLQPPLIPERIPRTLPITAVPNYRVPRWPTNFRVIMIPSNPTSFSASHQIFTDGSNIPNPGKGGCAYWDAMHKCGVSRSIPFTCSILYSELKAIILVLHSIRSRRILLKKREIAVFVDNAQCLQLLKGTAYPKYANIHQLVGIIFDELHQIEVILPQTEFTFIKIRSHHADASHSGNHAADDYARTAAERCNLDPAQAHKIAFSSALYLLKQKVKESWHAKWATRKSRNSTMSRLLPTWPSAISTMFAALNADEAAMIVRLLSEHIELNAYYHRFDYDPTRNKDGPRQEWEPRHTALCQHCRPNDPVHEELEHFLLECSAHDTARQCMYRDLRQIHPQINTTLTKTKVTKAVLLYPNLTWPRLSTVIHLRVWKALLRFVKRTGRFADLYGLNTANLDK